MTILFRRLLAITTSFLVLVSASEVHAGALVDEIRRELPADLTEPVILRAEGTFIADRQPIRDPGTSARVTRLANRVIDVQESPVGRIATILGQNFGIVIRVNAAGYIGSRMTADSGPTEFSAKIPQSVKVQLPAKNTVAPAQSFNIDSSWSTLNDFSYEATGPQGFEFISDFLLFLEGTFGIKLCFVDCVDFNVDWSVGPIDFPIVDMNFGPFSFAALNFPWSLISTNFPDVDLCPPINNQPTCFLEQDPYIEIPILDDLAPGVLQINVLKKSLDDVDLIFANSASQGQRLGVGRTLTNDYKLPVVGLELDATNLVNNLSPLPNPPLNGDLRTIFEYYAPRPRPPADKVPLVRKVVDWVGSYFRYNLVEAAFGLDFEIGESYALRARAPMITFKDENDAVIWQFRAGEKKVVMMPDDLDTRTLTMSVDNVPPLFDYSRTTGFDPRFEFSALGFSFNIPTVGAVGVDPLFSTGDLIEDTDETTVKSTQDVIVYPEASGFVSTTLDDMGMPITDYTLAPIQYPTGVTGSVFQSIADSGNGPRVIVENEPIDFSVITFQQSSDPYDPDGGVVLYPPGLAMRNVQIVNGVFNLIGRNTTCAECKDGNFLALAGNTLLPSLDDVTVNFAIHQSFNSPGASNEMLGGMAFANNWGSFIRHSRIFLAPDESDGTIWIADTDLSGAPGNLSGNYFRAQPQPQVTVKTRIEVYSGNTDEADNNLRLVELAITDSEISAQDFVLETKDFERTITPSVGDPYTVSIHNPVNVTVQDSIVHSNLEMFPADSEFDVSGSSLIAGRVGKGANFSRNNGLISIGGDENFATVLDTGELFSNLVSGRINVGRGGLLSVRTDNRLSSTGFVNLRGSYKDSANDAIAIVNTLADGYSSDDLFAGFKAGPIDDATMLIDGGDVTAEMINSYGATVIGLSGSMTGSLIENDHGRFVVDSDDGDTFSLTDSQFAGTGYVDILAGGHLQITGGPLSMSNDVVPTFLAHTGRLDITNRGSVTVEGDMTVEFRGDVSPVGNLSFQNSGDVQVQDTAYFQFSGNAIAENYGLFDINSGGVVAIVERETPLYDQSGMPIVDENDEAVTVFTSPTFAQNDGLMVVNGVLTFDEANDSSLLISGGSVNGSGSVEGDIVNSGGLVKPGNSVGTLTVTGDYTQSDIGALQIDLDATGSSFLDIGGTATIGGALRVVLDSAWWGTDPQAYPLTTGTSIAITSHADLIGEFETVSVNLSDGSPLEDYVFRAEFSQAQITLTFEEAADPTDLVGATGVDLTPPEITAPQDINAEATGAETPVAIGMAIATDNVAVFGISNDAQATYPIGTTTVTWTARDEIGNSASAVQMVTVVDTTAPVVTAPADIKVKTNKIVTPADLGEATVTDFVGVISLTNDSPGLFAKGETIVTWTATDAAGNVGTDTQIVTAKKSGGSFSLLGLLFLFGMALGRRRWSARSPD